MNRPHATALASSASFPAAFAGAGFCLACLGGLVCGQVETETSAVTSGGGWSVAPSTVLVSSLGQTAFRPRSGGDAVLYGGFLGAAYLAPHVLSTNGVPQEMDPDDDGDGLSDWDEVTGVAFLGFASTDPDSADTDGDGMSDFDEAALMFDPNDSQHALRFTEVAPNTVGGLRLAWRTKGGDTTNRILRAADLVSGGVTNPYLVVVVPGGLPPWYKRTAELDLPGLPASNLFLRVMIESQRSLEP